MKLKEAKNPNYTAIVVEIKTIVPLENCDNVVGAIILGNQVIVDKTVNIGDKGLYFPLESQLSNEFVSEHNLYRDQELNKDKSSKGGYFDKNRRIRCQKFMKNDSEGFFMPIDSVSFTGVNPDELNLGDEFDELNGIEICRKYVSKEIKTPGTPGTKKDKNRMNDKMKDKLVDKQFKFHDDTILLFKHPNIIKPDSIVHMSYKQHGSSGLCSNVLVKRNLKWYEKALVKLGINIPDTEYGYIFSSGKPKSNLPKGIVGKYTNDNGDFYPDNIWKDTFEYLKDFLVPGLSIYYEIVGYTKSGSPIQKKYDYGCVQPKSGDTYTCGVNFKIAIYRVTMTNIDGVTVEFSPKQVQYWSFRNGLVPVYELYYGYAKDLFKLSKVNNNPDLENNFGDQFLELCKELYTDKDCFMCSNKVPEEGVVIRIDGLKFEAYKVKSPRFLTLETSMLDKGVTNIEDEG
jgi:hypothetical protein